MYIIYFFCDEKAGEDLVELGVLVAKVYSLEAFMKKASI